MKKMKKRLSWEPISPRQINFSVTLEAFTELARAAAGKNMSIADVIRQRLGYPTQAEVKKLRKQQNLLFNKK